MGSSKWLSQAAATALLGTLVIPAAAGANVIAPNTVADEFDTNPDACSLREAVQAANTNGTFGGCSAGAGDDVITLGPGTYTLTRPPDGVSEDDNREGDLDLLPGANLDIVGSSATIDAVEVDRVIHILSVAPVSISGVTITGGGTNSSGAGILNQGALALTNSTVTDNRTKNLGGGIYADGVSTALTNVTISGNRSDIDSAGLDVNLGNVTLQNVTVTGNIADADDDSLSSQVGGVFRSAGTVTLRNTIVAGNVELSLGPHPSDCGGTVTSGSYNLIGTTAGCTFAPTTGDLLGAAANLGPLAANGGSTPTHGLLAGSAAIGTGNPAAPGSGGTACPATDQRGLPRGGAAGRCDIGAFELQPTAPPAATPTPRRKKCKKGRKLVRRKGKLKCKRKKRRR